MHTTYRIELCDEDGNILNSSGLYELKLSYQPEERVGGHLFASESVSVVSITGPSCEEVDEEHFRSLCEEMHDIKLTDYMWQDFLINLMGLDDYSSSNRWW